MGWLHTYQENEEHMPEVHSLGVNIGGWDILYWQKGWCGVNRAGYVVINMYRTFSTLAANTRDLPYAVELLI